MTTLEHKKYGTVGGEFIFHHCMYKPRRLVLSLLLTTALATAFQIYEMDVVVLWTVSVCLGVLLVYRLLYKVRTEAVVVLPSVGLQVRTRYWLGGLETHFFDSAHVRGIVINEAITMHSVLSYLAVLVTSGKAGHTESIFPLFTQSSPGQRDLVRIYQAVEKLKLGQPPPPPPSPLGPRDREGRGENQDGATGEAMPLAETADNWGPGGDNRVGRRNPRRTRSVRSGSPV